jgi:ATP adenylyltransferase
MSQSQQPDDQSIERNRNIWAPWRMEYIDSLSQEQDGGCFLCRLIKEPENDAKNFVLWRGLHCLALLNRFPYTGGHSMIAPMQHVGDLSQLSDQTMLEIMALLRDMQQILQASVHADGFNVGINIGRCAGAGLPGHLHVHIVPRWGGDTNFIAVFGGVRVIPQTLDTLYELIKNAGAKLLLPKLS